MTGRQHKWYKLSTNKYPKIMITQELVIKSDNLILIATDDSKAEIIKTLQKAIADLENDSNISTRSLYTKDDILYKLNNVLTLHIAKGSENDIDLKEMQILADDCKNVDCQNCAFDNVVEMYDLWNRRNQPLLERIIRNLELIPHDKFRSVNLTIDILIATIKASIVELENELKENT